MMQSWIRIWIMCLKTRNKKIYRPSNKCCPLFKSWDKADKNPTSWLANRGHIRFVFSLMGGPITHHEDEALNPKYSSLYKASSIRWDNEQYIMNLSLIPLLLFKVTETILAHIGPTAGKHAGRPWTVNHKASTDNHSQLHLCERTLDATRPSLQHTKQIKRHNNT